MTPDLVVANVIAHATQAAIVTAAAALLLLFSRKTFREQESSAERLYGPPKNWRDMVP